MEKRHDFVLYFHGANFWTYVSSPVDVESTPHCIFVGYSKTEDLFELGDIEKRAMIRKRDVIFWEHELGHPSLKSTALTHGISIYPQLNSQDLQPSVSALAGRLVRDEQDPVHYVPPAVPPNDIPLHRPPVRQTIQKLHPETKQRDRIRQPGEPLQFIPWQPPPSNSIGDQHDMYWITTVDTFDEQFMASINTQPNQILPLLISCQTPTFFTCPLTPIFHHPHFVFQCLTPSPYSQLARPPLGRRKPGLWAMVRAGPKPPGAAPAIL